MHVHKGLITVQDLTLRGISYWPWTISWWARRGEWEEWSEQNKISSTWKLSRMLKKNKSPVVIFIPMQFYISFVSAVSIFSFMVRTFSDESSKGKGEMKIIKKYKMWKLKKEEKKPHSHSLMRALREDICESAMSSHPSSSSLSILSLMYST